MNALYMHFLIAFVWTFLIGNLSLGGFIGGLFAGYLLLVLFRRALMCENYVRRTNGLLSYAIYFLKEVLLSNLRIVRVSLSSNPSSVKGRFIAYDVEGLKNLEVLLLSHSLNLTPGTIVAKKSHNQAEIVIHTFAVGEAARVRESVDKMKARIMRFTR